VTDTTILLLVCRVLHIAATCTSLGGLFYARMVTLPILNTFPEPVRSQVLDKMIYRYAFIKWTGVIVVAVTGLVQLWFQFPLVAHKVLYLEAFALKMGGALGLVSITLLLALPDERLVGMRRSRGFWSGLNLFCGLIILIGAALMRQVRML
jgi:hypothetical protein